MDAHLLEPVVEQKLKARFKDGRKGRRFSICHVSVLCLSVFVMLFLDHAVSAQSRGTLRIYLARHGETEWNAERRLQGRTDVPLNSTGRQQAAKLAERLKGIRLDAIYCSTLNRSVETATIARNGLPLNKLPGLNERNHGKFEGTKVDGSDPAAEQEWRRRRRDPDDELDGGESLNQFYERVRATFETFGINTALEP